MGGGDAPLFIFSISYMFPYPERKLYDFKIEIDDRVVHLKYQQATAEETYDYFQIVQLDIEKIKKYWSDFIKKSIVLTKYHKRNIIARRKLLHKMESQMFDILPQLQETLHKQRKSVYTGIQPPKQKVVSTVLFDNSYTAITEATHIPSDEIYKRLTFEQLIRRIDKLRFDSYEQTKE